MLMRMMRMMMVVVVMIVNLQSTSNISGKAILSHGTYWGNHLAVHIEIDQDTKAEHRRQKNDLTHCHWSQNRKDR